MSRITMTATPDTLASALEIYGRVWRLLIVERVGINFELTFKKRWRVR